MLAAPRIVRIERAVRPCLPMTLPRSAGATRSINAVPSLSGAACTVTSSGRSTSALAMPETRSIIDRVRSSRVTVLVATSVIAHLMGVSTATDILPFGPLVCRKAISKARLQTGSASRETYRENRLVRKFHRRAIYWCVIGPAMSLREYVVESVARTGAFVSIFGNALCLPMRQQNGYLFRREERMPLYAATSSVDATAGADARSLPTRSDNWAPLPVQ